MADWCAFVTLVLRFFTQMELKEFNIDQKFIVDNRKIAIANIRASTILQLLAFLPCLLTGNEF